MYIFIVSLHVTLCVLLVIAILMQPGKGADISSAFGGGASTQLFGGVGPGNFLTRGTAIGFALFMVTSVTLVLYSGTGGAGSLDVAPVKEGEGFGVTAPSGTEKPAEKPAEAPPTAPVAPAAPPDAAPAGAAPAAPVAPAGAAPAAPAPAAPAPAAPAGAPAKTSP